MARGTTHQILSTRIVLRAASGGTGNYARYCARLYERVHRLLDSLGDPCIAIAPKERIAELSPRSTARSCSMRSAGQRDRLARVRFLVLPP